MGDVVRVAKLQCKVKFAWWWRLYVAGVVLMASITGMQPNYEKVTAWANRAISIKIIKGRKA